ncbi:MurR/RpiR family transcriptional regulator [Paracoccus niistensis]|uniref:MurR/RpiR family transcriptional regulator n=1 Tax=Paracoccus niistensis TaxID=632935 RepID=A0ABV6I0Y1_9RHOB
MTAPKVLPVTPEPPRTLAELRALAVAVARGDGPVALGSKARTALVRIIEMGSDPALLSITTLADSLSVSPSTLTRLARSLGYAGYPAFQQVLLSDSLGTGASSFYSRHAHAALEGGSSQGACAARLCRENQANIERFIEMFDEGSFAAAVEAIIAAPRVMVHGIRQFHSVASFLVYGLGMIRSDVALLDSNNQGVAEGLAMLGAKGVLISTSCAPYSAPVVRVAAEAHRLGLTTIAITDRATSPLAGGARAAILVPHETSFLSNSVGAFIVAVECLINACAAARPDSAREALRARDGMIERLSMEVP